MTQGDFVLQPLKIKDVTLRNRLFSAAHASGLTEAGLPQERYQQYHLLKITGGLGLTIIGAASVAPDSVAPAGHRFDASHDEVVLHLQRFAQRIHDEGGTLICQLSHRGSASLWDEGPWLPAVSASAGRGDTRPVFAKAAEDHDISRLQLAFAWAMRRCRSGGLDGCELPFGDDLFMQFLSPNANRRGDAYGGGIGERLRFAREVLEKCRKMVGADFLIGARLDADRFEAAGLERDALLQVAATLANDGFVDYLNVGIGSAGVDDGSSVAIGLEDVGAIKDAVEIPVFCDAANMDLEGAGRALESGRCDLVGLTRAVLADPQLVSKFRKGRADDIRPCVGTDFCLDRGRRGHEILCLHNPAVGRETAFPQELGKARQAGKRVAVVGAGPAGLEAARVCAARGHAVTLFERQAEVGGQLRLAAETAGRESLRGIVDWLSGQVRAADVDLRLQTEASVDTLQREEPDVIIIATGGIADRPQIEGAELAVTGWDILSGRVAPARQVLICDEQGAHRALSCAAFVAGRDGLVELASRGAAPGESLGPINRAALLRPLYEADVVLSPNLVLREIYSEDKNLVAVLRNLVTGQEEERLVEQVVTEFGSRPDDALYYELKPHSKNLGQTDLEALIEGGAQRVETNRGGWFQLYRIGDAITGRDIHAALYDAFRLCRQL